MGHAVQSTICKPSTDVTRLPSASSSPLFTPCKLKLMACLLQPRMQRRNQRRPWWMPHALLTSLEPSRIMQHLWVLPRTLLETNLESLKVVLQIEEAEEIAALNLAKFRKAQQELEETEERAKLAMVL